jgi:hypothetical protein
MLRTRCRELGVDPPSRSGAWRSWAWLVVHGPSALAGRGRPRWLWTLACRLGSLQGAARERMPSGKARL